MFGFKHCAIFLILVGCAFAEDPLPSWNEGPAKKGIIQFVEGAVKKDSQTYIPPEERIATFDQDGTLWVEQPLYTQLFYALDTLKKQAVKDPSIAKQEPMKSLLAGDTALFTNLSEKEIAGIIIKTHTGMSEKEFIGSVSEWLSKALHPRYKKPFTELVYQPMLEVIKYLKGNSFDVYIVSGGGQEFIRAYAERVYGIPPQNVIGTAGKVKYEYRDGNPVLTKIPEILYINDKAGKPEGINLIIGRQPVAAFGNSTGDKEMLEWTQAGKGNRLELLVHHDDPDREYDYGPDSKIGTFPTELINFANQHKWIVVSMKNDWKVIFPFELKDKDNHHRDTERTE